MSNSAARPSSPQPVTWLPTVVGCIAIGLLWFLLVGGFQQPLLAPQLDFEGAVPTRYFDIQGLALLAGHLDAPCDSLALEAFVIGDRCYGYFGLTPSLLRLIVNGVCPSCLGHWTRIMMIAGGLVCFFGCVAIAARARPGGDGRLDWPAVGFAMTMSLGSTLPFIVASPYVYSEAILWGSAFAIISLAAAARYVDTGDRWALRLALLAVFLALHARVTVGFAAAFAVLGWIGAPLVPVEFLRGLLCPMSLSRPKRTAAGAVTLLVLMMTTPFILNEVRFGQLSPPFQRNLWVAMIPERVKLIADGNFQLNNLRCSAALYLSPQNIRLTRSFPWLLPGQPENWQAGRPLPKQAGACAGTHVESMDQTTSLPYAATAPLLLALAGVAVGLRRRDAMLRRWGATLAGGAISVAGVMTFSTVAYRYQQDFFILLLPAALLGWTYRKDLSLRWQRLTLTAIGLCVPLSFWVNFVLVQTIAPQPYMQEMGRIIARVLGAGAS